MQTYMRICPICAKENKRKSSHSNIYVPGWIDYYISEEVCKNKTCVDHPNQKLIKSLITCEEFQILREISNEPSFMSAMDDLKSKDVIEFNLKMSQFKTQVSQMQTQQNNNKDILHCPKCNSTAITTGARGVNNFWGMLGASKTVNRCGNCGFTWKP